ncbi:MAG TPA: M56 family metallopeptidase [Bryobacteraceae bacterium]|jgi:uncharacterized protein (TIGR03435 family)|nr:M56 family metallopeptidase [Bryobacteraceae bacterium]
MNSIADHLWQSTLFAGVVWLLTLVLRKNHARVRHALWLAASIKFLVPFSLFIALGSQFQWRTTPTVARSNVYVVMDQVSQPFTAPAIAATAQPLPSPFPAILSSIWACGVIGITCAWWVRWRRIRAAVRAGKPVNLELPIRAISSPTLWEPGVFGIFRPVLLLPEGIFERLTPAQLNAVVAHELCHVRHRDNLIATTHMFVETVFWLHPLVWWIGKRMVEERERACDEVVLRLFGEPKAYAEGILNVCKLYVQSPLTCVSGVTGANLKKRLETIMTHRAALGLNLGKKMALAVAALAALALPIVVGMMHAQSPATAAAKFEVASIKLNTRSSPVDPGNGPVSIITLNFLRGIAYSSRGGRFNMERVPLTFLIELAYNVKDAQLLGGPSWATSDRYEVSAKAEDNATFEQMRPMLRSLLADRFKLELHRETKEAPAYELAAARGGLKIIASKESCTTVDPNSPPPPPNPKSPPPCGSVRRALLRSGERIEAFGISMPKLIEMLSDTVGRTILDKTGFTEMFDVHLEFATDEAISNGLSAGPSIFAALQEQLGLRLESAKRPGEFLVIDHAERPSEN